MVGIIPHDLRRCAARNLSLSGVREQLAMKITGHKTNSMYRRYRIVDEDELRQAQEQQQAFLKIQRLGWLSPSEPGLRQCSHGQ